MKRFDFNYENLTQLHVLESILRLKADDVLMYIDRFKAENDALGVGIGLTEEQQNEINYALSCLIDAFYNSKDGNFADFSLDDFCRRNVERL